MIRKEEKVKQEEKKKKKLNEGNKGKRKKIV
jgi:hypothetical protein